MTTKIAEYGGIPIITDPEEIRKRQERMDDPNIITGKEGIYYMFQIMGMHIEWDEIFSE